MCIFAKIKPSNKSKNVIAMKRNCVYLFVSMLVLLFVVACGKEKPEVVSVDDRFDYGNAFGKHLIRETLLYPDGSKMDARIKWDSCRLMKMSIISDSVNLNILFNYNGDKVSEIIVKDGTYDIKYVVKYRNEKLYSVINTVGRKQYGMLFENGNISSVGILNGLSASYYRLTWENGNLVRITKNNSYMEFQYDNNPTQCMDIPSAYYLLGDIYNLVHLSVNNVVSVKTHNSEGDDTVYFSYNYTSNGYPTNSNASDGTMCYYLYADGEGSTYDKKKVGGS